MEIVVTQTSEKETQKNKEKSIIKVTSSEPTKPLVTLQIDEDDNNSLGIPGPIDIDKMRASEMMNIASVMQPRAHKKRLKQKRVEAETIQNAVDILSSLLPDTSTTHLTSPIRKLGQLVADAFDQIKSLEEATQTYAEKNHKKKNGEKLAKDINTGKMALSQNKDLLGKAIEIGGRYLASTSNVSFCYFDITKRQTEIEKELERICNTYVPLQDSIFSFTKSIDDLHHRLETYDHEKAKRLRSLKELKSLLTSQVDILQRAYSNAKAILATLETCTLDSMEEFHSQLLSTKEYTETVLVTWTNAISQLKQNFNDIFMRLANA